MRRKLIAVIVIIIIATTVVLTFGLFKFSTVTVETYSVTPTESGQQQIPLTVDVLSQGQKIGESFSSINMLPGKHTLTFGDYSDNYTTPSAIEVDVPFFLSTKVEALYYAKWGMLVVTTTLYDAYNQSSNPSKCTIFVDGQPVGNGSIAVTYDATNLGGHVLSFPNLDGYTAPYNRTVSVEGGQTTSIQVTYNKQLTSDEELYVWARRQTSYETTLDPQSNIVTDKFLQWTLNSKISVPFCYFYLYYSWGSPYLETYISQYAGVLESERVAALINIYNRLKSNGLDIQQNNDSSIRVETTKSLHYSNGVENIVTVELRFNLNEVVVEKGAYSQEDVKGFNKTDLSNMISMLPGVIPVGFAYDFGSSYPQLFIMVGGSTEPMRSVYGSFSSFSSEPQNYTGGYFDAWGGLSLSTVANFYLSNSFSQITQIVKALTMGTILVDPAGFLSSLVWKNAS